MYWTSFYRGLIIIILHWTHSITTVACFVRIHYLCRSGAAVYACNKERPASSFMLYINHCFRSSSFLWTIDDSEHQLFVHFTCHISEYVIDNSLLCTRVSVNLFGAGAQRPSKNDEIAISLQIRQCCNLQVKVIFVWRQTILICK